MKHSRIARTYRISITEGIFAQIYGNLATIGSGFIVKLLVMLGASPMQFSMLSAIGQVSQVFQPLGVAVNHNLKNRKKNCVWITFAGRFFTFFLGFSFAFLNPDKGILFVLLLLLFSAGLQSIGANIWIAWISDLIPLRIRGRFFSRRNQYLLSAGLIVSYTVSFLMDMFEDGKSGLKQQVVDFFGAQNFFTASNQATFLSSIFVIATMFSIFGLYLLSKQPEVRKNKGNQGNLKELYLTPLRDANFRRFLFYGLWWMMAIGIGSAFWSPFMLQKLRMSMFEMQVYGSIHIVSTLLAYNFWGRFIDRHGNKSAMKICIFLGGINPMLWLLMNADNYNVIWFEGMISGFMWAGAGIVATNFVLSIAPKGKEQVYSGIYGAVGGVGMMATTLLSGLLYPSELLLGGLKLEPEQVIFGIGGILRWTALIPLFFVHEPGSTPLGRVFVNLLDHVHLKLNQLKEWFRF